MRRTTLALAGALILCAGASAAQPPPSGPPPAGERGMRMPRDPAQMAERRAQHLRDVLQLRPDQDAALTAFLDTQRRPDGRRMGGQGARPDGQALTTPQKLDQARARMAEAQARFEARATAIRRFYAQLSPSQQKAFDALPMGGRRMAMRRGGPGGRMGPGGGGPRNY